MARPSNANLDFISVNQAASMMSVCPKTVRRRIADGDLTAHRLGRLLRISLDDYRAYVSSQREWHPGGK